MEQSAEQRINGLEVVKSKEQGRYHVYCDDLPKIGLVRTLGLSYRRSMALEDRQDSEYAVEQGFFEPWGSFITASLVNEDWVHATNGFLPTHLSGLAVLKDVKDLDVGISPNPASGLQLAEEMEQLKQEVARLRAAERATAEPFEFSYQASSVYSAAPPSEVSCEAAPPAYCAPSAVPLEARSPPSSEKDLEILREELIAVTAAHSLTQENLLASQVAHAREEALRLEIAADLQKEAQLAAEARRLHMVSHANVAEASTRTQALEAALSEVERHKEELQRQLEVLQIESDSQMSRMTFEHEEAKHSLEGNHQTALMRMEFACRDATQMHANAEQAAEASIQNLMMEHTALEQAIHTAHADSESMQEKYLSQEDSHQAALLQLEASLRQATQRHADSERAVAEHSLHSTRLEQDLEVRNGEHQQKLLEVEMRLHEAFAENDLLAEKFESESTIAQQQIALHNQEQENITAHSVKAEAALEAVFREHLTKAEEALRDSERKRGEIEVRAAMLEKQLAIAKQTAELTAIDRDAEQSYDIMNKNMALEVQILSRQVQDSEERENDMAAKLALIQQEKAKLEEQLVASQAQASYCDDRVLARVQRENDELRARLSSAQGSLGSLTQKIGQERRASELDRLSRSLPRTPPESPQKLTTSLQTSVQEYPRGIPHSTVPASPHKRLSKETSSNGVAPDSARNNSPRDELGRLAVGGPWALALAELGVPNPTYGRLARPLNSIPVASRQVQQPSRIGAPYSRAIAARSQPAGTVPR